MKILIIGGGNMGLTYARAFLNSHVVKSHQLTILERAEDEKVEKLTSLEIATIRTDPSCVSEADLIILAVKPQDSFQMFDSIAPHLSDSQVLLSIMAGVKMKTISQHLGVPKVIRAMPNLPAQIGLGMTVFTSTTAVSRLEEGAIQNLLATTGKTLSVENEELIDAATAISGSGPAYIFYFMEAMIRAATEMGIKPVEAKLMVLQTFQGALSLFQQNSYECEEWIARVSSRGGTTEAAIDAFNHSEVAKGIAEGAQAAYERAVQLGN